MSPNVESPVTLRRCQKDKGRGRKERKKTTTTNKQKTKKHLQKEVASSRE